MTEDEFGDIDLLLGMNLYGYPTTVVINRYRPVLYVNVDLERVHTRVIYLWR